MPFARAKTRSSAHSRRVPACGRGRAYHWLRPWCIGVCASADGATRLCVAWPGEARCACDDVEDAIPRLAACVVRLRHCEAAPLCACPPRGRARFTAVTGVCVSVFTAYRASFYTHRAHAAAWGGRGGRVMLWRFVPRPHARTDARRTRTPRTARKISNGLFKSNFSLRTDTLYNFIKISRTAN